MRAAFGFKKNTPAEHNPAAETSFKDDTAVKTGEPKKYAVIMLNDDFTTMEFVVKVLINIFGKDESSAKALMMAVHKSGRASVGIYPYDIAVSKVSKALTLAKQEGFPFRMSVEESV